MTIYTVIVFKRYVDIIIMQEYELLYHYISAVQWGCVRDSLFEIHVYIITRSIIVT